MRWALDEMQYRALRAESKGSTDESLEALQFLPLHCFIERLKTVLILLTLCSFSSYSLSHSTQKLHFYCTKALGEVIEFLNGHKKL